MAAKRGSKSKAENVRSFFRLPLLIYSKTLSKQGLTSLCEFLLPVLGLSLQYVDESALLRSKP
jgi:hypothetical protein